MEKPIAKWCLIASGVIVGVICATSAYQIIAANRDTQKYPAPGRLVDVGGYKLHINCTGKGDPTVVIESAMSGWSTDWTLVQPQIAKTTRICTYDRAGYGWSDTSPKPRDSQHVTAELHTLLANHGITGDIVLVGHSLGGLFAQHYAKTYPEHVKGIVLLDSVHPNQSASMREDERKRYEGGLQSLTKLSSWLAPTGMLRLSRQPVTSISSKLPEPYGDIAASLGYQSKSYRALNGEMILFHQSQAQTRQAGALPKVPLAVISSTKLDNFPPGFTGTYMQEWWQDLQADLAASATIPQVVAAKSGHYVQLDEPELVISAILAIVTIAY